MEQIDILHHAVESLDRMNVPYIVVGSIASIAYGESRFTQDIDIIAAFEIRHVDELLAAFPSSEYFAEGGGDRHLRDIAGILRVTGDGVDRAEVERWATELGYLEIWQQIVAKVDAPDSPPGPGAP
jgi:hypothetical protein